MAIPNNQQVLVALGGCRVVSAGFPGAPTISAAWGIVNQAGATQPAVGQFVLSLTNAVDASRTQVAVTVETGTYATQAAFPVVQNPPIAAFAASPPTLTVQPASVGGFTAGTFNVLIFGAP